MGVEVIPRSLPQPTPIEKIIAGDYQPATISIVWTQVDLGALYRCDAILPAGFNLSRHCNEDFDRLISASAAGMDAAKRRQMIIDQGNISYDVAAHSLLYISQSMVPVNIRLKNTIASAHGDLWSLSDIWVEAE
jgi:ABC-type transport system substrate-binding protein